MKVGKLLQPTIVYIGNAEKTFIKKVAKNDMSDPKRLKKELPKIIKKMAPEDRILFVGTSLTPWDILLMLKSQYSSLSVIIILLLPISNCCYHR